MAVRLILFTSAFAFVTSYYVPGSKSNLLSVIQIYRHGQRTPVKFYPTDPYQDRSFWPTTPGQLTNVGKQQHYDLGQYARIRYDNFLSKKYTKEEFRVEATNSDRTFMSAASNVAGLFPPIGDQIWKIGLNWQPIPVFPVEIAVLSSFETCVLVYITAKNLINTDPYFLNINEENQDLFAYLSTHTGLNITNLFELIFIYDTLYIEDQFNYRLPKWTESVFPQPLTNLTSILFTSFSFNEELQKITTGPFLKTLIEHFEGYIANSTSTQKYKQFSCHDINLSSILISLGAYIPGTLPGFASTIFFELREINGIHYINIFYRNDGILIPITVAGCNFDCNLTDFKNIVSNLIISVEEWYAVCKS